MLNPTIASIAKSIAPAMSSIRVFCPCEIAMNTITPTEPIIGTTVIKTLPMPPASGWSGGTWISICPEGSSGALVASSCLGWTIP